MYTLQEVAKAAGVQVRTVREWLKLGKIKATKDQNGYRWLVSEDELRRLINGHKD